MTNPTSTGRHRAVAGPVPSGGRGRRGWGRRVLTLVGTTLLVVFALLTLGPRVLPYRVWYVRSGSMAPTMPVGSLTVFRPTAARELGRGDVIAFHAPGGDGALVAHRIVRVVTTPTGRAFETRGDANGRRDAWRVPARGTGWRAEVAIPYLGYALAVLTVPAVRLVAIAFVAIVAAVVILIEVWRPRRRIPTTASR